MIADKYLYKRRVKIIYDSSSDVNQNVRSEIINEWEE